ncbi:MAG TPA: hypothetical protein DCP92_14580 [Nitrospiraceae bacterium]|jgi:hypothetical protein|nr:hypothetical protein [Nitrospiraceae bacterium]
MDKSKLKDLHDMLYDITDLHPGLWERIGEVACTAEYLLIQDPLERVKARLDAIEAEIGITADTKRLRSSIKIASEAF